MRLFHPEQKNKKMAPKAPSNTRTPRAPSRPLEFDKFSPITFQTVPMGSSPDGWILWSQETFHQRCRVHHSWHHRRKGTKFFNPTICLIQSYPHSRVSPVKSWARSGQTPKIILSERLKTMTLGSVQTVRDWLGPGGGGRAAKWLQDAGLPGGLEWN